MHSIFASGLIPCPRLRMWAGSPFICFSKLVVFFDTVSLSVSMSSGERLPWRVIWPGKEFRASVRLAR